MGLRSWLDSIEHHFHKGGKYEKFYAALYEAVDTGLFKPASVTKTTAHVRDGLDLKRMMITVWLCTFPVMFAGMWNVGFQANTVFAANPICWLPRTTGGWPDRAVCRFRSGQHWDNLVHGAAYFLPIYW
jgi:Na+-transporting NADH:ubiquinone oxidoreductase subunit B